MKTLSAREVRGFTLVEILTAVAIIGILSTIIFASINEIRAKGRDAKRVADIEQIELALRIHRSINNEYPTGVTGTTNVLEVLATNNLMEKVPTDPKGDGSHRIWQSGQIHSYYYWDAASVPAACNATHYVLWYHLERNDFGNAPTGCFDIDDNSFVVVK